MFSTALHVLNITSQRTSADEPTDIERHHHAVSVDLLAKNNTSQA